MLPNTETPPRDPSVDGDRPLLRQAFGRTEPDPRGDRDHIEDADEGRATDPVPAIDDIDRDNGARSADTGHEPTATEEPEPHDPAPAEPASIHEPASPDEPASIHEPAGLQPGEAPVNAATSVWAERSAQDFRDRWREAQLSFVDDPRKAATDTRDLVDEAVEALTAALASHREQLNSWPTAGDTEQYRVIVQRYRTFFERLLTL